MEETKEESKKSKNELTDLVVDAVKKVGTMVAFPHAVPTMNRIDKEYLNSEIADEMLNEPFGGCHGFSTCGWLSFYAVALACDPLIATIPLATNAASLLYEKVREHYNKEEN